MYLFTIRKLEPELKTKTVGFFTFLMEFNLQYKENNPIKITKSPCPIKHVNSYFYFY